MAFQSNYANAARAEEGVFSGVNPGSDISKAFSGELGSVAGFNNDIATSFAGSAIEGQSKWQQAKAMADAYKQQADAQRSASKKKGFFRDLFDIGSTIAGFIPGGQPIAAALGVGAKAFG